ncbi:MAG: AI-2E family transporter [Burkholderiales bacterium]
MSQATRLRTAVYALALALMTGWLLYIGRGVFVPIVFAGLVVYVILGLTRLVGGIPGLGPLLSPRLRFALAILLALSALAGVVLVLLANIDRVIASLPKYEASLLASIQGVAARFGMEDEPSWRMLWQALAGQVNVQALIGTSVGAATAIVGSTIVVLLYVVFILAERVHFPGKVDRMFPDAQAVARIRTLVASMNARIGSYLALKTLVSALLAFVSWLVMLYFGLELALFWALLIGLLNYVPYLGSFLGVVLPVSLAVVQFADLGTVVALLAALTVVQFVIGNFLDPYLLGNSLNLSTFTILASLTVWSGLWGIPGAFLAVPLTAVMVIALSEFRSTRPVAILLSRSGDLT